MRGCSPTRWLKAAPTGRRSMFATWTRTRISPDDVRWMRFSDLSWTHDGQGFFYSRYPEPPKARCSRPRSPGQALYYHRVGTPQSEDVLIYERKDLPAWFINGDGDRRRPVPVDSHATRAPTNNNRLYFADLGDPASPHVARAGQAADRSGRRGIRADRESRAGRCTCASDTDAPNRQVIAIDLEPGAVGGRRGRAGAAKRSRSSALIGGRLVAQ